MAVAAATPLAMNAERADGHHVQCGDTITRDTKLDRDLVECPEAGVIIGSDNITLDLGSHTLDGDSSYVGSSDETPVEYGVDNQAGHSGLIVRNGTVQDFYHGLQLSSVTGNRIRDLGLARNDVGIDMAGSSNRVEGTTISDSDVGMRLEGNGNLIERNALVRTSTGISLLGDSNVVVRNRITDGFLSPSGGGFTGIGVYYARNNRIEMNFVSGQRVTTYFRTAGISLIASSDNTIKRNDTVENSFGIIISCGWPDGSNNNRIEKNQVARNRLDGIAISLGLGFGVCRLGSGIAPGPFSIDNVVSGNVLNGNLKDGIYVEGGEVRNLLEHNTSNDNTDDGIDVDEPTSALAKNHAAGNGDFGIEAVTGTNDSGGNRAFGNGNPLQCLNVAC
jgi:parallel beta-helix repeat protein